jgi:hypothetical protein
MDASVKPWLLNLRDRFQLNLTVALAEFGRSRGEFGRSVGITEKDIDDYLCGTQTPTLDVVMAFERELGLKSGSLVEVQQSGFVMTHKSVVGD